MTRLLSEGMVGTDVKNLQSLLNYHLPLPRSLLAVDGSFGLKTRARVVEFQTLNHLQVDGVVGPQTTHTLLDSRTLYISGRLAPVSSVVTPPLLGGSPLLAAAPQAQKQNLSTVATPPVTQPAQNVQRSVQFQAGSQATVNPWFFSPLVLTGQFNILARNAGRPDFMISLGGQLAWNLSGPSGVWAGQGFVQMGPNGLLKHGALDVLNPFVQLMLQASQSQPVGVGLALGNQVNVALDQNNRWSLFLNAQAVVNVELNNGQCSAPSGQILGGVSLTFDLNKK
jgi:hypothetical protein